MEDQNFLDSILSEVGEFGSYQKRICFFLAIAISFTCFGTVIYVFETKQVNHRCRIPKCESNVTEFEPPWWTYAIPANNGKPSKCSRFRRLNNDVTCNASDFDTAIEESCNNFVYETTEISILQDFNLQCEENVWKLTLVGTINSVGLFIGLPIAGMLSDRFGRKTVFIYAMVLSGIFGMVRSFTNLYGTFMALEFLESICRGGGYFTCYVLVIELVGPKKRSLVSLLIHITYSSGGIFQGLIAWSIQSWRNIVRVLYALYISVIFYYWLIPESIRWLLIKQRFSEAQNILENVSKENGKTISEESLQKLTNCISNKNSVETNSTKKIFTSARLVFRIIDCSLCWLCYIFLYMGLTIDSVEWTNNSYLNFILTFAAEIPGNIVAFLLMDRIGRRLTLTWGFSISGLSCIVLIFIPKDVVWLKTVLYLIGKFGVSMNISPLNNLTTEIFPTPLRNTLLSTCSMFGRIGGIVAPQMPLLAAIWEPLPMILFGGSGLLAAVLILLLPETKNFQLPSTVEEALMIGKQKFKLSVNDNF